MRSRLKVRRILQRQATTADQESAFFNCHTNLKIFFRKCNVRVILNANLRCIEVYYSEKAAIVFLSAVVVSPGSAVGVLRKLFFCVSVGE